MTTTEQENAARKARLLRRAATACLLFSTAVLLVVFVVGGRVHWTSWLMMAGVWMTNFGFRAAPTRPAHRYLLFGGAALTTTAVISLWIIRP
jgi:hypothetical protein